MQIGQVDTIFIGREKGAALDRVMMVEALPGMGLVGDRHFDPTGNAKPENQITLIERESLQRLAQAYGIILEPADACRNILTSGIALNDLVGKDFWIGEIHLRGVMLCEPCYHLVCQTDLLKGLVHRGGLRAQILSAGMIRVGDSISEAVLQPI